MASYIGLFLKFIAAFTMIALASRQIGDFFARVRFPLISGFLFTGIIAGPFVLGLIPAEATERLRFVDEIALAFIAFAAGSELYVKEMRSRFRSITIIIIGQIVITFSLGSLAVFLLAESIPFMQTMSVTGRVAVAILAGAILVARSPSSAIAIIKELRAKGPFTQTVLGVIVIMDVAVIILFAINSSIADALLNRLSFNLGFVMLLVVELTLALVIGYFLGQLLRLIVARRRIHHLLKAGLILLAGYGVFVLSAALQQFTHHYLSLELFLEPLLICMVGGFIIINNCRYRQEFLKILQDTGPPIYIAFFTLTGASLALDILAGIWPIALALFVLRLGSIFLGSFIGGTIAGDPRTHNRISWMTYVTQAGVGLGLAKEVAVEFPEWGTAFATTMISVIVLNQIVGPPFFKWAINLSGETHPRAKTAKFDGVRDAIIFGLEGQSLALARQLHTHGWRVKVASRRADELIEMAGSDLSIYPISGLTLEALQQLEAEQAEAIIALLSDEENHQICELAYENFGTKNLIVRLHDRAYLEQFQELGVLIVDPTTAIVSLLDHFVRSPAAASLFLGMEKNQDIIEIEVQDPNLQGIALRDLRLPLDTLILSVQRNGQMLISHGYTRLERGDRVTVVGSLASLEGVRLKFERGETMN